MRHEDLKGIHDKLDQILESQPAHPMVQPVASPMDVSPAIELLIKQHGDELVARIEKAMTAQFALVREDIKDLRKDVRDDLKEITSNVWKGVGALGVLAALVTACTRIFH